MYPLTDMDNLSEVDKWLAWLLDRRFGGNAELMKNSLQSLIHTRDVILHNVQVQPDNIVLDIGTGDGIIGLGALSFLGEQGRIILSDISEDALSYCAQTVTDLKEEQRVRLLQASCDDLSAIKDNSIDCIVGRAVLIYVEDKKACFREFYRVLKPGGRLSINEPINRFSQIHKSPLSLLGFDLRPLGDIANKILSAYGYPFDLSVDPMLNFDERSLFDLATQTGFTQVHYQFNGHLVPQSVFPTWETFLQYAPNPNSPTFEEVLAKATFTDEERSQVISYLQPVVERGEAKRYSADTYVWAMKE